MAFGRNVRRLSTDRNGNEPPESGSTFVSSYFQIDPSEVQAYIDRKGFEYKMTPDHLRLCECPFCVGAAAAGGVQAGGREPGATGNSYDRYGDAAGAKNYSWKFYVFLNSGRYKCYSCNRTGTWYDLKRALGDISDAIALNSRYNHTSGPWEAGLFQQPDSATIREFHQNLLNSPDALRFLTGTNYEAGERGISIETLERYGVGACIVSVPGDSEAQQPSDTLCIAFPWTERMPGTDPLGGGGGGSDSRASPTDLENFRVLRWKLVPVGWDGVELGRSGGGIGVRYLPKGGAFGFFGEHTVDEDADAVVVCESEFDAMMVGQYTGLPAIALPHGSRLLPPTLLSRLERFSKIYLWLSSGARSQEQAQVFARKLGIMRVFNVKLGGADEESERGAGKKRIQNKKLFRGGNAPPADVSELVFTLARGRKELERKAAQEIEDAVSRAERFRHENITSFEELRSEVLDEFVNADGYRGLRSTSFPTYTRILKGFRRGELTVVTGPTGVGKTSFLSQLSLDYAQQGVQTLWGSFEIQNKQLAKKMLSQYAQEDFSKSIARFHKAADDFQELPIYFLRFFGMTEVEKVIDAMDYAVYVYDVQHILLDNLQFMMGIQHGGFRTKFDAQDYALDLFRKFSTRHNVHVTLVVHPRKEMDKMALGISSVFGTAKATQEADNVVILQKPDAFEKNSSRFKQSDEIDYRVIDIKKNRYDGELGAVPYKFERDILTMVELSDYERMQIGLQPVAEEFPDDFREVASDAWTLHPDPESNDANLAEGESEEVLRDGEEDRGDNQAPGDDDDDDYKSGGSTSGMNDTNERAISDPRNVEETCENEPPKTGSTLDDEEATSSSDPPEEVPQKKEDPGPKPTEDPGNRDNESEDPEWASYRRFLDKATRRLSPWSAFGMETTTKPAPSKQEEASQEPDPSGTKKNS